MEGHACHYGSTKKGVIYFLGRKGLIFVQNELIDR